MDFGASFWAPVAGATAGTLLSSMLGGGRESPAALSPPPPPPLIPPPPEMPTADGEAVRAAQLKSVAVQRARRGRASTILSDLGGDGGDRLGG